MSKTPSPRLLRHRTGVNLFLFSELTGPHGLGTSLRFENLTESLWKRRLFSTSFYSLMAVCEMTLLCQAAVPVVFDSKLTSVVSFPRSPARTRRAPHSGPHRVRTVRLKCGPRPVIRQSSKWSAAAESTQTLKFRNDRHPYARRMPIPRRLSSRLRRNVGSIDVSESAP